MPSAGQVEQYAYCAHNWWLARAGEEGEGPGSQRGMAEHRALGLAQRELESEEGESRDGLRLSLQLVALAASMTLLVIVLVKAAAGELALRRQLTLAILGLVFVSGAAGLLSIGLLAQRRFRRRQRTTRLAPGRLSASDLLGEAPILTDPEWDLTGRPDYMLATHEGTVPVEVKTGRTPPHPHHSHVLQLACYLRLVEVRDGKAPVYGLVSYPDGFYRVEWTAELRNELRRLLERMHAAAAAGKADRDHEIAGRCKGCSRREACTQRLA